MVERREGEGEGEKEYDKGATAPAPAPALVAAILNVIDNYVKRKEKEEYGLYALNMDTSIAGIEIKGALAPNMANFKYNNCFEREECEYGTGVPVATYNIILKFFERTTEGEVEIKIMCVCDSLLLRIIGLFGVIYYIYGYLCAPPTGACVTLVIKHFNFTKQKTCQLLFGLFVVNVVCGIIFA